MDVNSSLADAVIAERRALDEWYESRNADWHTQLKKLGDWECARRQRQLASPDRVGAS
jgi:hypothetical protein